MNAPTLKPGGRIILIGCGKTKSYRYDRTTGGRVLPENLYTGELFRKASAYARRQNVPWFVLSARFGLWRPDVALNPADYCAKTQTWTPYDEHLSAMNAAERAAWHTKVAHTIVEELWEPYNAGDATGPLMPKGVTIEIHAGAAYCKPLAFLLCLLGFDVAMEFEGMGIGDRLAWYKAKEQEPASVPDRSANTATASAYTTHEAGQ